MLFTLTPMALPAGYGESLLPLAAAKHHLRVGDDEDDDLIVILRDAALQLVEQHCGVRLRKVEGLIATFVTFGRGMRVGVGPIATVEVSGISYRDKADALVDFAGDVRVGVDGALCPTAPAIWPMGSNVIVTFSAGYAQGACPPALIAAAKLALGHLYAVRDVEGEVSVSMPGAFGLLCRAFATPVI